MLSDGGHLFCVFGVWDLLGSFLGTLWLWARMMFFWGNWLEFPLRTYVFPVMTCYLYWYDLLRPDNSKGKTVVELVYLDFMSWDFLWPFEYRASDHQSYALPETPERPKTSNTILKAIPDPPEWQNAKTECNDDSHQHRAARKPQQPIYQNWYRT